MAQPLVGVQGNSTDQRYKEAHGVSNYRILASSDRTSSDSYRPLRALEGFGAIAFQLDLLCGYKDNILFVLISAEPLGPKMVRNENSEFSDCFL